MEISTIHIKTLLIFLLIITCNFHVDAQSEVDEISNNNSYNSLKHSDDENLLNQYDSLVKFYERTENYDSLIWIKKEIADYFLKQNKLTEYVQINNNVGYYYTLKGQHDKSVDILLDNLRFADKNNLINVLGEIYLYLGFAYRDYSSETALNYFNLCLDKETDTLSFFYSSSLNEIANIYNLSGKYDLALQYYLKALEIRKQSKQEERYPNIVFSYNDIAVVYENMKEYDKAIQYMKKCIELTESQTNIPYNFFLSLFHSNIAHQYTLTRQFKEAEDHLQKALSLAKELDNLNLLEKIYQSYYAYYKSINKPTEALKNYELAVLYKDSLNKKEVDKTIADLDRKYQTEKQKAEIAILKKENYIKKLSLIFILILLFVILIAAFLIISKQIKIRKTEKVLNERLSKELEYKRIEIINFSSYIRQRISFTNDIATHLKKIKSEIKEATNEINKVISFISLNYRNERKMINDVYTQIEDTNKVFSLRLKKKHENLTNEDIRLASLLILNLTSKEISEILFISAKSVEMKRYRLRKKLGLEKDSSLIEYLIKI